MSDSSKSDLMSRMQSIETPVDSLSSILMAQQQLLEGTSDSLVRLQELLLELETIARQERMSFFLKVSSIPTAKNHAFYQTIV